MINISIAGKNDVGMKKVDIKYIIIINNNSKY